MVVYRLAHSRYIRDLTGEGARLYGGRWNSRGYPLVYTSFSRSLALLEILVQSSGEPLPENLSLLQLELPSASQIKVINFRDLPGGGNAYPSPDFLRDIGNRWIEDGETLCMKVPSALIREESNLLINPHHHQASLLMMAEVSPFSLDDRF